jgi:Putative adhesin
MKSTATWPYKAIFLVFVLYISVDTAYAQQISRPSGQGTPTDSEKQAGNNFHSSFASAEFALDGRVVVQGAPFSAVGIKETTQILSDGRPFVRRMVASIYRDSEGNTRYEWGNSAKTEGAARGAMIYEAGTNAIFILDSRSGRLQQLTVPGGKAISPPRQVKVITPESPPDNITQVVGETIEPLGTKIIEGIKAEGVRVTTTIPATEMPNKQPAKVIYERWYSQELRRNLLIKSTDPRFGEASFRLTEIDRSEPASELFQVPAQYKLGLADERKPDNPVRMKLEQSMPVSIKLERGDKISVDNRTTGRIRITAWDKDFVEAKATSERGVEAIKYSIAGELPQKNVWLKADYARRDEAGGGSPGPKVEPPPMTKTPPTITKPTAPTTPTNVPAKPRQPGTAGKPEITYELKRDISNDDNDPPLRSDGRPYEVNLEVSVPRYAEIEVIKVTRSPVEVTGVETPLTVVGDKSTLSFKNIGAVEVRTRNGAIEVENASGLVDIVTASGPVNVKHAGGDVRVLSISGTVGVECVRGRVNIDNTDGAITLSNVQGDVDVSTSNSDVLFTSSIREGGRYFLKSMSGAVRMSVQDKPPGFTASLSSYRGTIENDFQLKVKQSSQHEETVNRRLVGSYGNGKAQLTLDTFDGEINLRKLAPGAVKECK